MKALRRWVERKLGGYRIQINPGTTGKLRPAKPVSAAVIGGGLAGLTAAVTLARRGFAVTLLEAQSYLGGKIGSWPATLPSGGVFGVEHGFHAFFRHYYNLNAFLDSLGLRQSFRSIEDYSILTLAGPTFRFRDVDRTPLFNLFSLAKTGVWGFGQVLANPRLAGILAMLRYDPQATFDRYDDLSYQDWADRLGLPASMRLMFNSFSRAFFAEPDKMSTAELLKSFHSFFLSHDGGLIYDYPVEDYEKAFLLPLRDELARCGAQVRVNRAVTSVGRSGSGFVVDGQEFDHVVLAADAAAAQRMVRASPDLDHPEFRAKMESLRPSQGYAVLRLWTDRRLEGDLPSFVITEGAPLLDSVTFYDRVEGRSRAWADQTGGGILELHCYALPEGLTDEGEIVGQFLRELVAYFPQLDGMAIVHQHLQVKHDFTSFSPGLHKLRPEPETPFPGLWLAGDWVKLPFPAMLMEAACSAGLWAANGILRSEGLGEEPVLSVPLRGVFAPGGREESGPRRNR